MKITTWNVNSLNVRLPHVLDWLKANPVDALALQETKMTNDKFPQADIEAAGFNVSFNGQKTYNGVALISPHSLENVAFDIPNFEDEQKRVIAATINGVHVINCYVPNGQAVDSDKYAYKLGWLDALHAYVSAAIQKHEKLIVVGDFNIAPNTEDTYDPDQWEGNILCSPQERAALQGLINLGLTDTWSRFEHGDASDVDNKERFTWWDYRSAGFRRNLGLRIDHLLASAALNTLCSDCRVDLEPRRWERPSDHAPVTAVFDL